MKQPHLTTRVKGSKNGSGKAQDDSKAQQARNPMLAVRLPRKVYQALKRAARDDDREFPDWFRRNVGKMLIPHADDWLRKPLRRPRIRAPRSTPETPC